MTSAAISPPSALNTPTVNAPAPSHTWEQAVEWLRRQPDQQALVRACYYDDPLIEAAERFFAGDEWREVLKLLPSTPGRALDVGAGRGISSYALARSGWQVTALEPDPSPLVGTGAIRQLSDDAGVRIDIVQDQAEAMPFADGSFDLVYGRQVLHHAGDLSVLCREMARVLRPGGRFVATREHVITTREDLETFLQCHPLHRLYGGEYAYPLEDYQSAIRASGLRLIRTLGPFDSVINYFPMSDTEWRHKCRRPLARIFGRRATNLLADDRHAWGRWTLRALAARRSRISHTPGRLYSFIAEKDS